MTDDSKSKRPRSRRFSVRIPIDGSTIDHFLDSEIMNLSKGGVFIRADITLPLGSEVDFEFTLPHSDRVISAKGVVVWARSAHPKTRTHFVDHPAGMGVQFKSIDPEDLEFILDELERLMRNN